METFPLKVIIDDSPYARQLLLEAAVYASKSKRKKDIFKPTYPREIGILCTIAYPLVELSAEEMIKLIFDKREKELSEDTRAFISWVLNTAVKFDINATDMTIKNIKISEYSIVQPPEINAMFDQIVDENTGYLFHGSGIENWFSILMNGLKNVSGTALMVNGAAYGSGIYMSDDCNFSYGYGVSREFGSPGTKNYKSSVIGVFEVHNIKQWSKAPCIYVISDEKALICRSILIIDDRIDNKIILDKISRDNQQRRRLNQRLTAGRAARMIKELDILSNNEFKIEVTDSEYGSLIMSLSRDNMQVWILIFAEYPSGGMIVKGNGGKYYRLLPVMGKKIIERMSELIFDPIGETTDAPTFQDFVNGVDK